jgi:hypothetical protein
LVTKKVVPISAGLMAEIETLVPEVDTTPDILLAAALLHVAAEIRQLRVLAHSANV